MASKDNGHYSVRRQGYVVRITVKLSINSLSKFGVLEARRQNLGLPQDRGNSRFRVSRGLLNLAKERH
jgi:hypothetical protein